MKYRGLFHLHYHIIPFFDKNNIRLQKKIKKYLLFLKRNNILIADFTWHSHLFCLNSNLKQEEISYSNLNLSPAKIFKLVKKEAIKLGITIIPTLEVSCMINTEKGEKEAHILVMHENEDVIYNTNLLYERHFPFSRFFAEVPADSLVVIAHPWRFGCGLTYFLGVEKTNEIIENYQPLIEYNGWIYPWYYLMDKIFRWIPFLKWFKSFRNFHRLAKKNFELEGLKNYTPFFGMDTHVPHLLPGKNGFVEFEIDGNLSVQEIFSLLREGKFKPNIPEKVGFLSGMVWIIHDLILTFTDEIILEWMINLKHGKKANFIPEFNINTVKEKIKY